MALRLTKQLIKHPLMKSAPLLLVNFLSIAGLNGCASGLGSGSVCEGRVIYPRPEQEICLANGVGGAGCFDSRKDPPEYKKPAIKNYVCTNAEDSRNQEEWIHYVLKACLQE